MTEEVLRSAKLCRKKLHLVHGDNILLSRYPDGYTIKRCRACNNERMKNYMRRVRDRKLKAKEVNNMA